jgi:hypothetical protein
VIVDEGHELDLEARARGQDRVPHPRRPVVLRPADDADVDQMPVAGKGPMPLDPGVAAEDHVAPVAGEEAPDQAIGRRRLPEELVDDARRAVAEQEAIGAERDPAPARQAPQPGLVLRRGVPERVTVARERELAVARIGVPAAAVGPPRGEGLVVVALDREDAALPQEGKDAVGVGRARASASSASSAAQLL